MSNKTIKTKTKRMTLKQREQAELAECTEVTRNYREAGNAFLAKIGGRDGIYLGVVEFLDKWLNSRSTGGKCVSSGNAWALLKGYTGNRSTRPHMRFDVTNTSIDNALEIEIPIFGLNDPNAVIHLKAEFVWKVANPFGTKKRGVEAVGLKWRVRTPYCGIPILVHLDDADGAEFRRSFAKAVVLRDEFNALLSGIKKHIETVAVNA